MKDDLNFGDVFHSGASKGVDEFTDSNRALVVNCLYVVYGGGKLHVLHCLGSVLKKKEQALFLLRKHTNSNN